MIVRRVVWSPHGNRLRNPSPRLGRGGRPVKPATIARDADARSSPPAGAARHRARWAFRPGRPRRRDAGHAEWRRALRRSYGRLRRRDERGRHRRSRAAEGPAADPGAKGNAFAQGAARRRAPARQPRAVPVSRWSPREHGSAGVRRDDARRPATDRIPPDRRPGCAPDLVHGRPIRLRLGTGEGLPEPDPDRHRPRGSNESAACLALVVARATRG